VINVKGFADGKHVYSSSVPKPSVPHEGDDVLINGKWWRVVRESWENSSDVRLDLTVVDSTGEMCTPDEPDELTPKEKLDRYWNETRSFPRVSSREILQRIADTMHAMRPLYDQIDARLVKPEKGE